MLLQCDVSVFINDVRHDVVTVRRKCDRQQCRHDVDVSVIVSDVRHALLWMST